MPVKYTFMGAVPNEEVHRYYAENRVDCFLSASSTEGLPVSIMEAISYGIPVVATDVGGTFELVKDNGILLDADPTGKDIADAVLKVVSDPAVHSKMSENSLSIWSERFDSEQNAIKFADTIEKIAKGGSEKIFFVVDSVVNNWPFISSEITNLAKHHEIILLDGAGDDSVIPSVIAKTLDDSGIKMIRASFQKSLSGKLKYIIGYFLCKKCRKEREQIIASKNKVLRRFYESSEYYSNAIRFYEWIKRENIINPGEKAIFYTYWHQFYTLSMVLHRTEYPNITVITREHGFDLYDERRTKSLRQPFRKTMDPDLDAVIFACETGKKYYTARHASDPDDGKYIVSYVGSKPHSRGNNGAIDYDGQEANKNMVRIVSCSSIVALKRIELIIEALERLETILPDKDIEWVHFGDGEERQRIEELAKSRFGIKQVG